jgi:hypothetical protein
MLADMGAREPLRWRVPLRTLLVGLGVAAGVALLDALWSQTPWVTAVVRGLFVGLAWVLVVTAWTAGRRR